MDLEAGTSGPRASRIKNQGSKIRIEDQGQGSGIKDQGPRIQDHGSRITDEGGRLDPEVGTSGPRGSRIKDQGPCPATNEHPRRDTDVILRQSKAPLELFNSR